MLTYFTYRETLSITDSSGDGRCTGHHHLPDINGIRHLRRDWLLHTTTHQDIYIYDGCAH